jgi:hypothetical protein
MQQQRLKRKQHRVLSHPQTKIARQQQANKECLSFFLAFLSEAKSNHQRRLPHADVFCICSAATPFSRQGGAFLFPSLRHDVELHVGVGGQWLHYGT